MCRVPPNISLIVGLSLPAIMVAIIAGMVFLPSKSLNPTTDFMYVVGQYPSYSTRNGENIIQHDFAIKDGKLIDLQTSYSAKSEYLYPPDKSSAPRFFIHHTKDNTNEELSFEDMSKLKLSSSTISPEGFTLTFGKRSYGIFPFFFDGNNDDREHAYLSTNRASKEITLISDTSITYYAFQLVGWVI